MKFIYAVLYNETPFIYLYFTLLGYLRVKSAIIGWKFFGKIM